MLSDGCSQYKYDSANRLIKAGGHTYTYNAEDVRIRNLCSDADTTYTYNTNCKLSQLLQKTTNGIITKYVYGLGLIGEEKENCFKTYHFDYRGSTVAITDINGNITDTFKYDTYGKLISRTGNSFAIFGYNGRDGVVTDKNGLIYMRARYYSPEMRRFINADVLHGEISDSTSLNRYSYVNGNPVSFVDPFGLERTTDQNVNIDSIMQMFSTIPNSTRERNIALITGILDLLMKGSELVSISNRYPKASVMLSPTTELSYEMSTKHGDGMILFSNVFNEKINLLKDVSIATKMGDFDITYNKNNISIGATAKINDSTNLSVSISGIPGISLTAEYSVSGIFGNSEIETNMSLEYTNLPNDNFPAPALVPQPGPAPDAYYNKSSDQSYSQSQVWQPGLAALALVGLVAILTPIPGDEAIAWGTFFSQVFSAATQYA